MGALAAEACRPHGPRTASRRLVSSDHLGRLPGLLRGTAEIKVQLTEVDHGAA